MQPPQETFVDLHFPLAGVDTSDPFCKPQPQQTPQGVYGRVTPEGMNVRTFEPLSERGRGGSRQGLSKYVSGVVVASWIIQLLDVIVSTDDSAVG